jgi:NTP pyrophosphatase (non-canonical NTP hydrolase)
MDQESSDLLTEVGLKLILFCGAAGISTEEVFDSVRQKIDKRLAEPFDQGHYGED